MNILIAGPGAMGCLFAAHLTRARHKVTLLDHRQDRADFLNKQGIRVEGVTGEFTTPAIAVTGKSPETPDLVLICVKASKTRSVAESLKSWLSPRARVLTLQNGLGNIEILEKLFGRDKVLGGVSSEGATLLGPGHVRHAGRGETLIGAYGSRDGFVSEVVKVFRSAGFEARAVVNVEDLIWGKLLVNVGINALTAITRLRNGRLAKIAGTRAVMEEAVREAVAVAGARGIHLPYPDPLERVLEVCSGTADNIASMLQDVLKRRTTEVSFINGAIVREGEKLGIPTPVNQTLTWLVQAIQETYEDRINGLMP